MIYYINMIYYISIYLISDNVCFRAFRIEETDVFRIGPHRKATVSIFRFVDFFFRHTSEFDICAELGSRPSRRSLDRTSKALALRALLIKQLVL